MKHELPIVAIVGRPNTGKSTIFNRLVGKRRAIESDIPGTTRDRIYTKTMMQDYEVMLVDTGGLEIDVKANIESDVQSQTRIAIEEADVVLFVIDARQELTASDFAAADMLRKSNKPCVLIANKCDNGNSEDKAFNLYELGFDKPIQVSAIHSRGLDEVSDKVAHKLEELHFVMKGDQQSDDHSEEGVRIGFFGKPNVGKSSLVNAFLNEQRVVVSDQPGTTRDSTDSVIFYNEQKLTLIDTAGLRRRGRISKDLEYYSVLHCFKSLERCDIALLILDASEPISKQDLHVAQYILEQGKGLIVVLNKSDLVIHKPSDEKTFRSYISKKIHFLPWAPLLFVSATTQKNIRMIQDYALRIADQRKKRVQTAALNVFMQKIRYRHPPMSRGKVQPKLFYASQVAIDPPHFVFFVNDKERFHFSYKRYLENRIREEYGFEGTAIKIEFRSRRENDANAK